jgi:TetR/AcrR family transcriptional regulator, transcriptional repressor for nem operon
MQQKATRDQIVEAADRLLYEKGFEYTSFADLAKSVGISRGNVTFHFATRDEVLEAVIDLRLERTCQMLKKWESDGESPEERIKSFINILITNRTKIMLYGCPVGTLCTELAKLEHAALPQANKVFGLFRDWLRQQFVRLGFKAKAESLALHVLAWSQGVATLASAFRDESFIRREVRQLEDWLDSLVATETHG